MQLRGAGDMQLRGAGEGWEPEPRKHAWRLYGRAVRAKDIHEITTPPVHVESRYPAELASGQQHKIWK